MKCLTQHTDRRKRRQIVFEAQNAHEYKKTNIIIAIYSITKSQLRVLEVNTGDQSWINGVVCFSSTQKSCLHMTVLYILKNVVTQIVVVVGCFMNNPVQLALLNLKIVS